MDGEQRQRISSRSWSLTKTVLRQGASEPIGSHARLTHVACCTRAHHSELAADLHWESDKHWEEGEDLSLLEFKTIEYKRKGYAIATDEQVKRIAKIPKREFMRRGINQHTLEKICSRVPVRAAKLARCLKILDAPES